MPLNTAIRTIADMHTSQSNRTSVLLQVLDYKQVPRRLISIVSFGRALRHI